MPTFKLYFVIKSVEYLFRAVKAGRGQDDEGWITLQGVAGLRIFEGSEKSGAKYQK